METRNCQNCKNEFVIEQADFNFYEKMQVPPPTFCPLCRAQRRMAFRNERKLFRIKDAFKGNDMFSLFPPDNGRKVVNQELWHSDTWDAMEYGKTYDFSRPFFEQFKELLLEVPIYSLNVKLMVNSPYCGNATGLKNCYLIFNSNFSENCMYGNATDDSRDCIDNSHIKKSERCYESFWLENCYKCYFSTMLTDCRDMWFSRDCVGSHDCFGCANLRNTSYCIFNIQYSKEEYLERIKSMKLDTYSGLMQSLSKTREFWNTQPVKYHQGLKNQNSTGSYVTNCKNVTDSYLVRDSEDMRYCQYMQVPGNKDCYDTCFWGEHMELLYESSVCGEKSYNLKFCTNCWPTCRDSEYCFDLFSSSDCFGCVGLKKKQYCILNTQYTKEEYFKMVKKIKAHMNVMPYLDTQGLTYTYGEYFPIEFSPFGYNNTVSIQHFPLTKEQALQKGYTWLDVDRGEYVITKKAAEIPDSLNEISDEYVQEVIECETCKHPYRILENELLFLRAEKLPLPRICNDCRHDRRISNRLKMFLYERACMCMRENNSTEKYKNTAKHFHENKPCSVKFKTGYSPGQPEIVYCEQCYQQEVY